MDLQKIGEGRRADIYAYEPGKVVKLYRSPALNGHAANEAMATQAVVAAGVPAPRCFGTTAVDGRLGILLEHLTGPELTDEVLSGDGPQAVMDLADLHARIHSCDGSDFKPFLNALEARIRRNLSDNEAAEVFRRMDQLDPGSNVLHTDLHVRNVMRNRAGAAVAIDWDEAYFGPALYGVARTRFLSQEAWAEEAESIEGFTELRRTLTTEYLAVYASRRPYDPTELDAWRLPVLAARLDEGIAEERDFLVSEIAVELDRGDR